MNDLYFQWMLNFIDDERVNKYGELLSYLYNINYQWRLPMDENRAEDGLSLRYRFSKDDGDYTNDISELDHKPCSMFEMMIALSIRCEENIMTDLDYGDRTAQWFFMMIKNLGLIDMDDTNFDEQRVGNIIYKFLNGAYEPDGTGGLFIFKYPPDNLLDMEIWYQMCHYLNEII